MAGLAGAQSAPGGQVAAFRSSPAGVPAVPEGNLSPIEQFRRGEQHLQDIKKSSEMVKGALEQARAARDVVKVLCLNDKLNQIDVASRSAESRVTGLGQAVEQNDAVKARHDYAVLQVLKERVGALVTEANQCVGEDVGFFGESKVAVVVDPKIPDPDTEPNRLSSADVKTILDSPVLSSPVL
jgi:hypothetical protein